MKFRYIEIAIASLLMLVSLYGLMGTAHLYYRGNFSHGSFDADRFEARGLHFDFAIHYITPQLVTYLTIYLSFIWVACGLPNRYIIHQQWSKVVGAIISGFIITWLLFAVKTYLGQPYETDSAWNAGYKQLDHAMTLYLVLLAYQAAKQSINWLMMHNKRIALPGRRAMVTEISYFVIGWLVVFTCCIWLKIHWAWTLFVLTIVPCAFITYLLIQHWLIPRYWERRESRRAFWLLLVLSTFVLNVPFSGLYAARAAYAPWAFIMLFCIAWLSQLCVLTPLSYYVYRYRRDLEAELSGLHTDLGNSTADAQFLRSQINPHFLFNALNTLYGMALTEQAEKTGEGIQKLGDMMRFMLHENHQERIALNREIDYLNNYINLQNMRIAASPDIEIAMQLQQIDTVYAIAPMLLIPFIENAYKHGISLKERSWIKVSLQVTDGILHFDVNNSVHQDKDHDPEKYRSGIGLDNVKQRLQLLYPQRHELIIRPTPTEFFIHLTLQLL
jgi:two-component system LytT family sensor kinase